MKRNKGYQPSVCLCSLSTTEDHTCSFSRSMLAVGCRTQCSAGLWAVLQVTLNCRSLVSPKWEKHWRKRYLKDFCLYNGLYLCACKQMDYSCSKYFSPILQKVPNSRPRVSCSISLQYVTSYPFALLMILMSLCFNRVPFIWELPYSTVSFCQNEINFNSPKTCWYNKVLRCRDKHAPCYWCQGMCCCTLNLFRDTDSEMTFKVTAMIPCILCLVPTRVFSFKKFWNTGQKNLL